MNWKNGRPDGWKNPYSKELEEIPTPRGRTRVEADEGVYEAGADDMHKADLEFLEQFPDVIMRIKASMTKEQWQGFTGEK